MKEKTVAGEDKIRKGKLYLVDLVCLSALCVCSYRLTYLPTYSKTCIHT